MRARLKANAGRWMRWCVENLTPFGELPNPRDDPLPDNGIRAESPDNDVLIELVRLHARALKRLPLAQLLVVLGLGAVVCRHAPASMFLAWSMLTLAIECLRAVYAESVLRRDDHIAPRGVHHRFVALAAVAGSAVGLGAACFMPRLPILDQALIAIVLFAMPAAGITVAVSSKHILAFYALGILAPAAATWAVIHPPQALPVGELTALYWGFMVSVAADGEKLLLQSVRLRHQRDRMVKELELSNTEIRTAVDRAEQAAQARARVLAAASHDLRQPLQALSVYSAILAANPSPESLKEVGANIERIVFSLGGLLDGLLDISSLASGRYELHKQVFSLDKVAYDVCAEYESVAAEKNVALVRDLSPVRLYGDPVAVTRILRNLLDNAVKYTDHGEIRVETGREERTAMLAVADTGIGIPPEEHEHVFEEFYQLENPGRNRNHGVGLGLAIVHHLCELTGTQPSLSSELGVGTRVELHFPFDPADPTAPDRVVETLVPYPLSGLKVYIVDDDADIRDSLCTLLGIWGVAVKAAASAGEAEELFAHLGKPDLLIADLRLAGKENGAVLADRLKLKFGNFGILIITAENTTINVQSATEYDYALMRKPIAPADLYAALCKTRQIQDRPVA